MLCRALLWKRVETYSSRYKEWVVWWVCGGGSKQQWRANNWITSTNGIRASNTLLSASNAPSNASTLSVWGQDFGFAPAFSVVRLLLLFCQAKGKLPLLLAAQTSPALCPVRPCPTYLTFRQAGMYSARPYLISLLCSPPMCSKTMAGHGRAGQYAASGSHRPFFHPTSRDRVHQLKSLGLQRFTTPL